MSLALSEAPVPSDEIQIVETAREAERRERLEQTMRTVQMVSRMAGNELAVKPANQVDDIGEEPAIYLFSSEAIKGEITDAEFALKKTYLSGAADSAHTVLAGDLFIDDSASSERIELNVAVKCFYKRTFEDRFTRALQEVRVLQHLEARGELAWHPIALVIAPTTDVLDREVILVTQYDGVLTLDNLPWGRGMTKDNISNALLAVHALGKFNAELGFRHGDAKIKNVAQDEKSSRFGMIDFETSATIDLKNPADAAETALIDFGRMIDSLAKKGFFRPEKSSRQSLRVTDLMAQLAQAYLDHWGNASTEIQDAVFDSVHAVLMLNKPH
jgi:hypothetical protein